MLWWCESQEFCDLVLHWIYLHDSRWSFIPGVSLLLEGSIRKIWYQIQQRKDTHKIRTSTLQLSSMAMPESWKFSLSWRFWCDCGKRIEFYNLSDQEFYHKKLLEWSIWQNDSEDLLRSIIWHLLFTKGCFGLLGVNGAGKTTSLECSLVICLLNKGSAVIGYDSLISSLSSFKASWYCPQFDAYLID